MLERAIGVALKVHAGQVDKGGQPYILHVFRVMLAVPSGDAQVAAVLHDVVEDGGSLDDLRDAGFSPEVLAAVEALTHRPHEPYFDYVMQCAVNPLAALVKIADLQDNLDASRIPNPTDRDKARWSKYRDALDLLLRGASPHQEGAT